MRSFHSSSLMLALSALGYGCADPVSPPQGGPAVVSLNTSRASAPNPRLAVAFDDAFLNAAIKSDGRGSYVDGTCGAYAVINAATGDGLFEPDRNYTPSMGSCGPRLISYTLTAGVVSDGSYVTIGDLSAISTSATVRLGFATSRAATGCDFIRFGYDNSGEGVLATRTSATEWSLETVGTSLPYCWVTIKNRTTKTQLPAMPLRMVLTQLP